MAEVRADVVLRRNWDALQETARSLVEHETLSGVALEALLSGVTIIEVESIDIPDAPPRRRQRELD